MSFGYKFVYVLAVNLTYLVMCFTSSTDYLFGPFYAFFCLIVVLIWLVPEIRDGNYENLFGALEFYPEERFLIILITPGFFYFGLYLNIKYIFELIVYARSTP